jgi:hypothetical protein
MKRRSPTLEGFQILFHRPSLWMAEVAWRWTFGGAAAALLAFSLFEYFDTLPVTNADLWLLRSQQPTLVGRALADIFHGSGPRLIAAALVLGVVLAVTWIAVASWGRAVTLRNLVGHFRQTDVTEETRFHLRSLAGLNFFRVVAGLAVAIGCAGAFVLGDLASPDKAPSPGTALLVFLIVLCLVGLAGACVNWFLSLAPLFVVRDGDDTFGAMSATAGFCRNRVGAVSAASFWFGLAHGTAFFVASSVVAFPLAFASVLPGSVVLGGVLLVTLLYFFVADVLYLGRLAAYVCIAEEPEIMVVPEVEVKPPETGLWENVDRSELILSDVPIA